MLAMLLLLLLLQASALLMTSLVSLLTPACY
jgi:hypothetical protein